MTRAQAILLIISSVAAVLAASHLESVENWPTWVGYSVGFVLGAPAAWGLRELMGGLR